MNLIHRHLPGLTAAAVAAGLTTVASPGAQEPPPRSPGPSRQRSPGRAPP